MAGPAELVSQALPGTVIVLAHPYVRHDDLSKKLLASASLPVLDIAKLCSYQECEAEIKASLLPTGTIMPDKNGTHFTRMYVCMRACARAPAGTSVRVSAHISVRTFMSACVRVCISTCIIPSMRA